MTVAQRGLADLQTRVTSGLVDALGWITARLPQDINPLTFQIILLSALLLFNGKGSPSAWAEACLRRDRAAIS